MQASVLKFEMNFAKREKTRGQTCSMLWDALAELPLQKSDGSDSPQFLDALECLRFENGRLVAISRGRVLNESTPSKFVSNEEKSRATTRSPFPTSSS